MTDLLVRLARSRQLPLNGAGRQIREAAGISLRELADEIGVNSSTLSRWERGQRPRRDAALRWEEALATLAEAS